MSATRLQNHTSDRAVRRRAAMALFLLIFALYLLTGAFHIESGDGEAMYQVTRSMVEGRGFAIPAPDPDSLVWGAGDQFATAESAGRSQHGRWGLDGQFYTVAGLGWSLAAVPIYVLGAEISDVIPGMAQGFLTRAAVTLVDTLALSLGATVLFLLAARLYPTPIAVFIALVYAFGSIAWAYARGTFSEPLVALGLLWAVYCGFRAQEKDHILWWGLAGLGLGGALLTRQVAAIMVLPLAAWALVTGWRSAGLRGILENLFALAVPVALAQGTNIAYNVVRFGHPLSTGYQLTPEGYTLPVRLYGLLLSPGKGLLVFVPLVLLGLAGWPIFFRKRPILGSVLLAMILIQFGVYASAARMWAGGASWGPRHLVPILAFCLLPIGDVWPVLRRWRWLELAAAFLLAASLVIQLLGITVNPSRHLQAVYAHTQDLAEYSRRVTFTWADSPIVGQLRSLLETTGIMREPESLGQLRGLIRNTAEQDPRDGQADAIGYLSYNVPDFWFVYWGILGVGVGWRIGLAVALAGLAAWAGIRLWRLLA